MFGPLLIVCALVIFAAGVLWIRSNVTKDEDSLIETIDSPPRGTRHTFGGCGGGNPSCSVWGRMGGTV